MQTTTFQFDQNMLDKLTEQRITYYKMQEASSNTPGAIVSVFADWPSEYMKTVLQYAAEGYTLHDNMPIHHTAQFCRCYMVKPQTLQEAEIEQLKQQVEAEYRANLATEKAKWLEQQSLKLLRERKEQEAAKQAALDAKQLAAIRKELEISLAA